MKLFLGLWILYGAALLGRIFFAPDNPILESIQRYALIAGLGALAAHFGRSGKRWLAWVLGALALGLGAMIGIVGKDWLLAAKLLGAFAAAWAIGSAIRGSSAASR
jgi:peptidoglycan/LPS O-acetylase OafA/YrhL